MARRDHDDVSEDCQRITLRSAEPRDTAVIIALHVTSWQETYRGLMPDAFLDTDLPEIFATRWRESFKQSAATDVLLIAERAWIVHGFVFGCRDPQSSARFFMDNMHVAAALCGSGTGTALMRRAASEALVLGFRSAVLSIIGGNDGARRLYERLGWKRGTPVRRDVEGLGQVDEAPFVMDDLARLAG